MKMEINTTGKKIFFLCKNSEDFFQVFFYDMLVWFFNIRITG